MNPVYREITKRHFEVKYSDNFWYAKVTPSDDAVDVSVGIAGWPDGTAKLLVALKGIAMKTHGVYEELDLTSGIDVFVEHIAETYVHRADKWTKGDVHREYSPAVGGGNPLAPDRVDEFRSKLKSSIKDGMEELLTW